MRPVYGHQKQGASFGLAKIAGRALLRLGLSPQISTLTTAQDAPVIAEGAWTPVHHPGAVEDLDTGPTGTHPLRAVRRELRLAGLRGDHP